MTALNLKIPSRDLRSKDARHLLTLIFSQWLSLSTCVVQTVIDIVPSPSIAQATRLPKMLNSDLHPNAIHPNSTLGRSFDASKVGSDARLLAYVSKMFAVPERLFCEKTSMRAINDARRQTAESSGASGGKPQPGVTSLAFNGLGSAAGQRKTNGVDEDEEVLLGFARLYSGTIRTGSCVYCVLPKYQNSLGPEHPSNLQHVVTATVEGLYMMMGRDLLPVECVLPGNIFAIKGLDGKVWRSATLCASGNMGVGEIVPVRSQACLVNLGRSTPSVSALCSSPSVGSY